VGFVLALAAFSIRPTGDRQPAAACRGPAQAMTRFELLFGMGRKDGGDVGEAEWRRFLDAEIAPRFPDGLTVLMAEGQWRNAEGRNIQETSRMLLIWAKPEADADGKIEAIRAAWKARFGQESVMRVDGASCVAF
jgi:hypothetical protein